MSKVIVGRRLRKALQDLQDAIAGVGGGKGREELEEALGAAGIADAVVNHALAGLARKGLLVPFVDGAKAKRKAKGGAAAEGGAS